MSIRSQRFTNLLHSTFRFTVGLNAGLFVLWIAIAGLIAVVANPYLIAALWLLGSFGLFACAGACISAFPSPGQGGTVPHPFRALICLTGAAAIGMVLWISAAPALANEPLGRELFGGIIAAGGVLGIVLVLLSLAVVRSSASGGRDSHADWVPQHQPVADFATRERVA